MWNRTATIRRFLSGAFFVVGLALLAAGEAEPASVGAALLGLSFVAARGAPWGDGSPPDGKATASSVSVPLLLIAIVLAAVAVEHVRDVASLVSDVEGNVSIIMSDVSDLADQRH